MIFFDKFKIQSRGLLLLLATTVLLAVAIPLVNFYLVFPRYAQEIIKGKEEDTVRFANHIAKMMLKGEQEFTADKVTRWTDREIPEIIQDFQLYKIKIFDSAGTTLFSTTAADIGKLNSHDYFHNVVAKGKPFTKVVHKDEKSLEGEIVARDVVETYVPIMKGPNFVGAFELYYDITATLKALGKTFLFSMLIPAPLIALFLSTVLITILTLDRKEQEGRKTKQLLEEQRELLFEDQKKQAEMFSLVENAKRQWETTMDCISELVILTDPGFLIKRCNHAVTELTGLAYRQLLGRNLKEIIPDTRIDGSNTTIGESYEYIHPPSGHTFYLSVFPVVETIDQEPGFVISLSDITSLKKLTETLAKTNEEITTNSNSLQFALDNISLLIGDAIEGKSYKDRIIFNQANKCWEAKKCGKKECPCYGKEGMRCWQQAGTFCGGEAQGEFAQKVNSCLECSHFKNVTRDPASFISEQFNNLMFMLESKTKELERAYTELKQTQAQLLQQEKMASVGQLAAGVAHEINNPVGFVSSNLGTLGKYVERLHGFITFLEEHLKTVANADIQALLDEQRTKVKLDFIMEDIKDLITESLDGCERVKKIVSNLKGFSRIDQAERQYININDCIDTTLNVATNELKYKTKIEKEYGEISDIECLPQQLNQVFLNLLINAAHAIEKEGVISIKTWQDEQSVYASFSDTGSGIKPENLPHIFEPFFTTKEIGKGTGLGLSIVYDIITKNHKGDIDVTSEVGMGTTFTIQLPRIQPKDSQPEQNT
jgi:PAS domain S-box-containing protein